MSTLSIRDVEDYVCHVLIGMVYVVAALIVRR